MKDGDRVVGARVEADGDGDRRPRPCGRERGRGLGRRRARRSTRAHTRRRSVRPRASTSRVPWSKVRNDIAAIVPVRDDRRSVFVVPWGDTTYIGTTDTDYDGPLDDPPCTAADVDYLLGAINGVTDDKLTDADVVGTWAGLRPLLRRGRTSRDRRSVTSALRPHRAERRGHRHRWEAHDVPAHGRRRGRRRRRRARRDDDDPRVPSTCACSAVRGSPRRSPRSNPARTSTSPAATAPTPSVVRALVDDEPELGAPLVPGLPYLKAEARYAVAHEMARTLDDVLSRRTRARLLARDASAAAGERGGGAARARPRVVRAPSATRRSSRTGRRSPPSAATARERRAGEPAARYGRRGAGGGARTAGRDLSGRPSSPRRWPPPAATGGRWR